MGYDIIGNQPKGFFIFGCILSQIALTIISVLLTRRLIHFDVKTFSITRWLVLAVYIDSYLFLITSTTLRLGVGLNSPAVCEVTILLCLLTYMSTKIIIYFFLVERVYIVRSKLPRKKDKLYLFNTFGVLLPFGTIVTLAFVYRIGHLDHDGQCKIGMGFPANIPLLLFDSTVNIYLTSLFLAPLLGLYQFEQANPRLRLLAKRTFIGSCLTLSTSIANLIALATQIRHGGEHAWICHLSCTADIIFAAIVLHWITSSDVEGKARPAQPAAPENFQCQACKNYKPPFRLSKYKPMAKFRRGLNITTVETRTRMTEASTLASTIGNNKDAPDMVAYGNKEPAHARVERGAIRTSLPVTEEEDVADVGRETRPRTVTSAIASTRDLESAMIRGSKEYYLSNE